MVDSPFADSSTRLTPVSCLLLYLSSLGPCNIPIFDQEKWVQADARHNVLGSSLFAWPREHPKLIARKSAMESWSFWSPWYLMTVNGLHLKGCVEKVTRSWIWQIVLWLAQSAYTHVASLFIFLHDFVLLFSHLWNGDKNASWVNENQSTRGEEFLEYIRVMFVM